MDLDKIFSDIIPELDKKDSVREELIKLSRLGIRNCSVAIKKLHRKEADASDYINEARMQLKKMINVVEKNPRAEMNNYLHTLYQEFVEAIALQAIFNHEEIPVPSQADPTIPAVSFLLGLCDTVGELRRACLDCVRDENFDDATYYFSMMEHLHDYLNSLDYPNAIIPNVRHKSDVNRKLINVTRSNLTLVLHMNKFQKKLGISEEDE